MLSFIFLCSKNLKIFATVVAGFCSFQCSLSLTNWQPQNINTFTVDHLLALWMDVLKIFSWSYSNGTIIFGFWMRQIREILVFLLDWGIMIITCSYNLIIHSYSLHFCDGTNDATNPQLIEAKFPFSRFYGIIFVVTKNRF